MSKQKKILVFVIELMILALGIMICSRVGLGMDAFNAMCIGLAGMSGISPGP